LAEIDSYRDLKVWQRAMDLATLVYGLTAGFPKQEQFGLTGPEPPGRGLNRRKYRRRVWAVHQGRLS
jgi:hypothetical protein